MSQFHLIICSGGTGGHFYPALSIAREFTARGGRVTFLVSGQQAQDQRTLAEKHHLEVREIPSIRVPRSLGEILKFPFQFLKCWRKLPALYRELNADAMLSMGSFTAVAPCLFWPKKRKPLILHEGNTFMGQANRIFAKKATAIALTLPLEFPAQCKGTPARIAGMPLRDELLCAVKTPITETDRAVLRDSLGLLGDRRTLLVFGGSQGARAIIDLVTNAAKFLSGLSERLQFIVLTGADDNTALKSACHSAGIRTHIAKRDEQIQRCYQAADAVLCRAGASSICELALFRKPALLMPLPTAKDNHQFHNAKCLADAGAAKLLVQSETTPESLASLLTEWLDHPESWSEMPEAIGRFARPNATNDVVDLIEAVLTNKPLA